MPIFNIHMQGEERDPRGKVTPIPAPAVLQQFGPIIPVTLMPLVEGAKNTAISGRALIDTGAKSTCVNAISARQAGLTQVDSETMDSATHANQKVPVFTGRIIIQGANMTITAQRAYGANLTSQDLVALIGRDILQSCVFVYNGSDGSCSLSL